MELMNRFYQS